MQLISLPDITYAIAAAGLAFFYGKHHMHMLQMNSYRIPRYARWFRHSGIVWFLTLIFWAVSDRRVLWQKLSLALIGGACAYAMSKKGKKKPLVITQRVVRLAVALATLEILASVAISNIAIPVALTPVLLALSVMVLWPIEAAISSRYRKEARAKLASLPELMAVGITGSYGKTSTKNFLAEILSQEYSVLASPASVNTPLGLTRVIRENLSGLHQVFIAEMGAKQRGDITELVQLVRPSVGIISSVGIMHLETFGSEEAIYETKLELAAGVDGPVIVDGDNEKLLNMALQRNQQVIACGYGEHCDYRLKIVEVSRQGTTFNVSRKNGLTSSHSTHLLGNHFIKDIVLAIAAAEQIGASPKCIYAGVKNIEPVKHRLEILQKGKMTIIDDSFNANPVGASAALDVIDSMTGEAKFVVTPGFIELGKNQEAANAEFAIKATSVADALIIVGETNKQALLRGDQSKTVAVKTLEAAMGYVRSKSPDGAIVLLENDLPDNYN